MGCAGCDDCPQDAWHLHVTVLESDTTVLEGLIRRHGGKVVRITNVMSDSSRNYDEIIPTCFFRGSESHATMRLFQVACELEQRGFEIARLKIEGDARAVPTGRALYYEAHLKNLDEWRAGRLPLSINARDEKIWTVRHGDWMTVRNLCDKLRVESARVEACVLDTAPELDDEWLRSYERGTVAP